MKTILLLALAVLIIADPYESVAIPKLSGNRPSIDKLYSHLPNTCVTNENKYFLPNSLIPNNYEIHFNARLDEGERPFSYQGQMTLSLSAVQTTTCVILNSEDLQFNTVILGNGVTPRNITFIKESLQVVILFDQALVAGNNYELKIAFQANIRADLRGFYKASYQLDGQTKWLAVTQFEALSARTAFPTFDEPRWRSNYDISFTVAKKLDVYSNMNIIKKVDGPNGVHTFTFAKTPKMSSYLVAFAVGEFEYIEKPALGTNFRVVATKGLAQYGHFAIDVAIKCTKWFNDFFGISYHLPKMDLIAIPDFRGGAMENWGLITFRNNVLLKTPETTQRETETIASIVVHEIAHMWTGNKVTISWWNELFLKEGWATFFAVHVIDILFPDWKTWEKNERSIHRFLASDSLQSSPAMVQKVFSPSEVDAMFNLISYNKGGAFYKMIVEYVGADRFMTWMKNHQREWGYKAPERQELFENLIQVVPTLKMDDLLSWSDKPGYPALTVQKVGGQFQVSQARFYSEVVQNPDNRTWWVPVTYRDADGTAWGLDFNTVTSRTFNVIGSGKWWKLNTNQVGIYRVNYPVEQWAALINAFDKDAKLSELDKLGLLDDAFAFAGTAATPIKVGLDMSKASTRETSNGIAATVLDNLKEISNRIRSKPQDIQTKFKEFVRQFLAHNLAKLGWERKPSDNNDDLLNRNLILTDSIYYEDRVVIREAESRYKEGKVPPELSQVVFDTIIRYGDGATFERFMIRFLQSTDPAEKNRLLLALTQTTSEDRMRAVLSLLITEHVRAQDGSTYFNYMVQQNQKSSAFVWSWFKENWERILAKYSAPIVDSRIIGFVTSQLDTMEMYTDVGEFLKNRSFSPYVGIALSGILKRNRYITVIYPDLERYLQ